MGNFPQPVLVPEDVVEQRQERLRQLTSSCSRGIAIRSLIILAEFVGVYLYGSSALLVDAIASLFDVFSSVLLVVCLKLAARPPDSNHPFGHGRYEPLIGFQIGIFMIVVGIGMFFQQTLHLSSEVEKGVMGAYAWVIPLSAVILLELCYHVIMRVAKRQDSPALAADAIHYRIDSITTLCATITLILAAYFPQLSLKIDHMGAIIIAAMMVVIGLYASRQNMNQILDHIPDDQYFDRVRSAASRVEGVLGTEKTRIQLYGPDAHVDIDVEVDPFLSVEVAHEISQKVRVEIQKDWPSVQDVIVHIEPYYPNDH